MATALIALLWLGFAVTHMGLSSASVRPRLVARLGEGPFLGLYSLISFLFFVPLVWVYFTHKHAGPWLWSVPLTAPLRWAIYVVMGLALVMAVAALARPSPASIIPGSATPRGMQRITRHPLFMGLGLFGVVHLIPNGSAADIVFFGGFPLFALVGSWHQDRRKLASLPQLRAFYQDTPFLPFTGRETLRGLRELSPLVVMGGIVATIVLRYYHRAWFGG
jgi:uncharacterized membrane protein